MEFGKIRSQNKRGDGDDVEDDNDDGLGQQIGYA